MERIYHHYLLWEDWKKGMYEKDGRNLEEQQKLSMFAKNLLSNPVLFENIALRVISEWKYATEFNLSNTSRNRQAWLGQASCCFAYGVPEYITKMGWHMLTEEQQKEANKIADEVINQWENRQKCQKNTSISQFC